nr:hypothetical protein [Tanacetum cinerariifolium]
MDQQNQTLAKIPILDTGKFEQWQFRIQQYLQHEHYALWEVIKFRDSYEVPTSTVPQDYDVSSAMPCFFIHVIYAMYRFYIRSLSVMLSRISFHVLIRQRGVTTTTDTASDATGKKKGRTVTLTAEDIKYKTAQELWAAILKTFGGNEATKKTKKNLLKQQYGNFKVEVSETLEQTFNRLQVIVGQLQFIDVEIEQDDLNQKFRTSLAPEWLMHTIVWRNMSDLNTMSLDDLYNHLKLYESEVQKKSELNSQNMAFISLAKHSMGNEDVNTASVSTTSTNVPTASANIGVVNISQETACAYIASQSSGKKISIQGTDVAGFDKSNVKCFNCHKMGYFARECRAPRSQDRGRRDNYRQGSKVEEQAPKALMAIDGDMSWTGLLEFNDDTVTHYSRPAPTIESSPDDAQNKNPSVTETETSISTISPKSFIKFVKANDSPTKSKIEKAEKAKKSPIKHMTGNISYLSDFEPFDGGYVSFGQGGCKITRKGTIKTGKFEFENVYFVKDL